MTTVETVDSADRSRLTAVPILANPYSGAGQNMRLVARLAKALSERGLDPEPVWGISERAELLAAPDLSQRTRCVVVAGGDGSISDVINDMAAANPVSSEDGLVLPEVPLALLPMGNENLLAEQFGYGRHAHTLAEAIERGRTRRIDLARAGQRLFTVMLSSGFDAQVVHHVDRWRRRGAQLRRIRRRSYAPIIAGRLWNYAWPQVAVEVDGEVHAGAHAFIFNLPQYGGGLPIGFDAKDDDGLLDWIVFKKPGLIPLARYGLSVIGRRHLQRGDVAHGRAKHLRLRSPSIPYRQANDGPAGKSADAGAPLQTDGDAHGHTPIEVNVCPQAIRVITIGDG